MINLKSIEAHFVSGINPCVNKVPDRMRFLGNLHYEVCLISALLKVFFLSGDIYWFILYKDRF